MSAVEKGDGIFFLSELLQPFLFRRAAVPHKAEIPENDERVALFQFLCRRRLKTGEIAVRVAGYVYHEHCLRKNNIKKACINARSMVF